MLLLNRNAKHSIKFVEDLDSPAKSIIICKGGKPGTGNYETRTYNKGKELKSKPGEEKEIVSFISEVGINSKMCCGYLFGGLS